MAPDGARGGRWKDMTLEKAVPKSRDRSADQGISRLVGRGDEGGAHE